MSNDIAVFLDLDNLVIGAKQKNMVFDINVVLEHLKKMTSNGRIVVRRSYGDWRTNELQLKALTTSGFTNQANVHLNNFSKNLADMQIIVDAMETLIDGHSCDTYALLTGDRDFTPLVQSLRKRGKRVIGVGHRHSTSASFADLCDDYVYYENLVPKQEMDEESVEELLTTAVEQLLRNQKEIQVSILRQKMGAMSDELFNKSHYAGSFSKWLGNYPEIVTVHQEGSTMFVRKPTEKENAPSRPLHTQYRSQLKRNRLRIIPAEERIIILRGIITYLQQEKKWRWRNLIDHLYEQYEKSGKDISKNALNATFLVARRSNVIKTEKDRSLKSAPVSLLIKGEQLLKQAVIRCDTAYIREISGMPLPFNGEEVALALYDDIARTPYINALLKKIS